MMRTRLDRFQLRFAGENDVPLILKFIKELAQYEKLSNEVVATEIAFYITAGSAYFGRRKYHGGPGADIQPA